MFSNSRADDQTKLKAMAPIATSAPWCLIRFPKRTITKKASMGPISIRPAHSEKIPPVVATAAAPSAARWGLALTPIFTSASGSARPRLPSAGYGRSGG